MEVLLSKGVACIIDPEDKDLAWAGYSLHINNKRQHAARKPRTVDSTGAVHRYAVYLACAIVSRMCGEDMQDITCVQFIDGDTLNLSRSNLRYHITRYQLSKIPGVQYSLNGKMFEAVVQSGKAMMRTPFYHTAQRAKQERSAIEALIEKYGITEAKRLYRQDTADLTTDNIAGGILTATGRTAAPE